MSSQLNRDRRDLLKSSCTLATAAVSFEGSLNAFAAGGAMPQPQAHRIPVAGDTFGFTDRDSEVDGILAYSAVCTHLGCMLSNWDAPSKQFRTLPTFR